MLMCGCDEYGPEFYSETWPVARKQHKCCECHKTIEPGDEYQYCAGRWEGDFMTFKTCFDCAGLWESLRDLGYCQVYGELWETHQEYKDMMKPYTPLYEDSE